MIEPIMYFGIGFLFATLIGVAVIPVVYNRAVVDERDHGNPDESCKQEADPEIHDRFDHWHNPALNNAVTPQGTESDSAREGSFELKSWFIFLRIAKNFARVGQHFTKILREPLSFTYEARFWPHPHLAKSSVFEPTYSCCSTLCGVHL